MNHINLDDESQSNKNSKYKPMKSEEMSVNHNE